MSPSSLISELQLEVGWLATHPDDVRRSDAPLRGRDGGDRAILDRPDLRIAAPPIERLAVEDRRPARVVSVVQRLGRQEGRCSARCGSRLRDWGRLACPPVRHGAGRRSSIHRRFQRQQSAGAANASNPNDGSWHPRFAPHAAATRLTILQIDPSQAMDEMRAV